MGQKEEFPHQGTGAVGTDRSFIFDSTESLNHILLLEVHRLRAQRQQKRIKNLQAARVIAGPVA
jgi:hypothetical protein